MATSGEAGEHSGAGEELDFGAGAPRRPDASWSAAPTPDAGSQAPAGGYVEAGAGETSPAEADRRTQERKDSFESRPELFAAGAFAGAFLFAKLLKRLSGGDR